MVSLEPMMVTTSRSDMHTSFLTGNNAEGRAFPAAMSPTYTNLASLCVNLANYPGGSHIYKYADGKIWRS